MKRRTRIIALLLALCGAAALLSGCGAGTDTPASPARTESPLPTEGPAQTALLPRGGSAEEAPVSAAVRLLCLNTGKSDCLLLLRQDRAYLIDGGYAQTWPALETALAQLGVTRLDGVFLTHCHKDHYGGLYGLAASGVPVDAWYAPAIYFDQGGDTHPLAECAALRGQEVTWLRAGEEIGAGEGAAFAVLGPLTVNDDNENNNSLVLRFSSPEGAILLAGDMKEDEEYELLAAGAFSPCDVLKVGHHGDNKATTAAMLSEVRPRVALICTSSPEEPDTPAASTVRRLTNAGSAVYVTQDFSDALLVTLAGAAVTVDDVQWDGVPRRVSGLALAMDAANDTLTLRNGGDAPVALAGYLLYSTQGNETLTLPERVLQPGAALVIGTRSTEGDKDLLWDDKTVWSRKKRDTAILYDPWGRPVAVTDNGLEE